MPLLNKENNDENMLYLDESDQFDEYLNEHKGHHLLIEASGDKEYDEPSEEGVDWINHSFLQRLWDGGFRPPVVHLNQSNSDIFEPTLHQPLIWNCSLLSCEPDSHYGWYKTRYNAFTDWINSNQPPSSKQEKTLFVPSADRGLLNSLLKACYLSFLFFQN
jgi:hypothetical protein